jgi:hypothetical protein
MDYILCTEIILLFLDFYWFVQFELFNFCYDDDDGWFEIPCSENQE